jgi:hypothetical protein
MHAAPPVAVRCTAGWPWRGVQTALPALAAAVSVFWGLSTWANGTSELLRWGVSLAMGLIVAILAWRRSARPAQTLHWDGRRWALDGQPGELQLMIDLGRGLLLRHAGKRWLLATASDAGTAWHPLRVAVLARATPQTDDGWLNA